MKAIVITRPGPPETHELRDAPDPVPGPGEVLVRVRATAVNRADVLQRRGLYPAPPGSPSDIPGLEFSGEVLGGALDGSGLAPGDRVMGILGGGGYAERLTVPAGQCLPVPEGLSWTEAAAIPEAFLTAFDALVLQAGLAPGETALITAAGSGVGTAAAQIAREVGARSIGTLRSAAKRERVAALDLGFAALLDAGASDLAAQLAAAAGPRGVDVVLDLVGAASWPAALDALAARGRIVAVGTMSGARIELDLGALMRRRATLIGTVLRSRPVEEKTTLTRAFAQRMLPALAAGRLRPVVDRVLPLDEAAAAHALIERNDTLGKVVLAVDLP
ncbi:MAG: NAD(P)H-quinone oxidoreductase [Acidobacteria bacterium]|nr:NAD(P)H-quinone oxidoreductase [Acidobacteriota bacterium]